MNRTRDSRNGKSPAATAVELSVFRVRIAALNLTKSSPRSLELSRFGIDTTELTRSECSLENPQRLSEWDVLLLYCPLELESPEGPSAATRAVLSTFAGLGPGVCVVLEHVTESVREWLAAGADAVTFADESDGLFAAAVHTAYNSKVVRRTLTARVKELETKLEESRLINHAKSIMAKHLNIPELDALQRLRKQSRSQRRPMAELAKVIIEANAILAAGLSTAASSKPSDGASAIGADAEQTPGDPDAGT